MTQELFLLCATTISVAFFHTILGPDHYLPFIVMAKSGKWSWKKTSWVTFLCGLGHVTSSILLAVFGVIFGVAIKKIAFFESFRGNFAAWALIAFGLVYFVWGIRRAIKNKPHTHCHSHKDGLAHNHTHKHFGEHSHPHTEATKKDMTPWVLFTIFVFGPCEPLIPLIMYPAAKGEIYSTIIVVVIFSLITVVTMLFVVMLTVFKLCTFSTAKMERYAHALSGFTILMCGLAIQFLGL